MAQDPTERATQAAMDPWLGSEAAQTRLAKPMPKRSQPKMATRSCGLTGRRCGCCGSEALRHWRAMCDGAPSDRRADFRASSEDMPERRPASRLSIKWSSNSAARSAGKLASSEAKGLWLIGRRGWSGSRFRSMGRKGQAAWVAHSLFRTAFTVCHCRRSSSITGRASAVSW